MWRKSLRSPTRKNKPEEIKAWEKLARNQPKELGSNKDKDKEVIWKIEEKAIRDLRSKKWKRVLRKKSKEKSNQERKNNKKSNKSEI